ncbi:MAG: hypothetical protein KIH08_04475 [Candidatus Freyarchaeota archaeon]|nr:hypothetical protein [Candidatus Jordarchaeia archaeon]
MKAEEVIQNLNLENLENLPNPDALETIWKNLTLPELKAPDTTLQSRILFMAYMIFMPVKALWTLCFQNLFKVKPEECPVCATQKKKRGKPHIVLHCPYCKRLMHSQGTNGRNPTFHCPNHGRLSIRRTYEARVFFILQALRATQLLVANLTQKKVAELLGMTRTFIETTVATVAQNLKIPPPEIKGDLVLLIFIDGFFGSRIAILVGKANKSVFWTFGYENTLTITSFLENIKKGVPPESTLVITTDGNPAYIDPIRSVFPEAIHVRHFHKDWNQAAIHYSKNGQIYSIHGPIDMLKKKTTAKVTVWEGVRVNPQKPKKASVTLEGETKKLLDAVTHINASQNYDGRLLQRFTRILRRLTELVLEEKLEKREVLEVLKLLEIRSIPLKFRNKLRARIKEFREATSKPRKGSGDKRPYVKKRSSTLIFKGTLAEAEEKVEGVREVVEVLNQAFKGGKLVNSPVEGVNSEVEYLMSSKNASEDVLKITLFNHFLHTPLKVEDATPLSTSNITRRPRVPIRPLQLLEVRYTDRRGKTSSRVLLVLSVNGSRVSAFCFLKGKTLTFLKSRMEILHAQDIPFP